MSRTHCFDITPQDVLNSIAPHEAQQLLRPLISIMLKDYESKLRTHQSFLDKERAEKPENRNKELIMWQESNTACLRATIEILEEALKQIEKAAKPYDEYCRNMGWKGEPITFGARLVKKPEACRHSEWDSQWALHGMCPIECTIYEEAKK